MKNKLIAVIGSIGIILLFNQCIFNCSNCLRNGESFDKPYIPSQRVVFVNDSQQTHSFKAKTNYNTPPNEYCGPIGSSSYTYCNALSSFALLSEQDSSKLLYVENISHSNYDEVELAVYKQVWVLDASLLINKDSVKKININGKKYSDIYIYINDSAKLKKCTYFMYSLSSGLLKYSIKYKNYTQNWVVQH